jgi:hypothetical protein
VPDEPPPTARAAASPTLSPRALAIAFVVGLAFVLVPVGTYAAAAPDFSRFVGSCGQLADPSDPNRVLLAVGPQTREVPVIEVLDPLCPACRGFEQRFAALDAANETSRRVLLFPLDDACNWMVSDAIHPGACAISEAVLCAQEGDGDADAVLAWAFENQERIVAAERAHEGAAARMARERFPSIAACLGRPPVQAKLNASLRWAVQNQLPILTPQVYVGPDRLCDADTDLGMDFALTRLVTRYRENPPPTPPPTEVESPRPVQRTTAVPAQPTVTGTTGEPTQPPAQPSAGAGTEGTGTGSGTETGTGPGTETGTGSGAGTGTGSGAETGTGSGAPPAEPPAPTPAPTPAPAATPTPAPAAPATEEAAQ